MMTLSHPRPVLARLPCIKSAPFLLLSEKGVVIYFAVSHASTACSLHSNTGLPLCTKKVWTKQSWDKLGHGLLDPSGHLCEAKQTRA
jgi:hypothetical protein